MGVSLKTSRVTVVEDHLLYAEALEIALVARGHTVERVTVGDTGAQTREVSAAILATRPSVVLLDLDLGQQFHGVSLLRPLRQAGVAVVVVTGSRDHARWGECLWHGAQTVLPKSSTLNTILATIQKLELGEPVITRDEAERYVDLYRGDVFGRQQARVRLDSLTPREREILRSLMRGRHVRDIAREKCVAESTVRTQVRSILYKLEVSSQLAAVGVALSARWDAPRSA